MFDIFSQVVREGLLPNLKLYIDWLLHEGKFLGFGVLILPLLARIIRIFKNLF